MEELAWSKVESSIRNEMAWLTSNIPTYRTSDAHSEGDEPNNPCQNCCFRQLAQMSIQGDIQITKIERSDTSYSFWLTENNNAFDDLPPIQQRKEWHRQTIGVIEKHFLSQGFSVTREPSVLFGRADLCVSKAGLPDLFVEVGTVSPFKLLVNLMQSPDLTILLVPNEEFLIEFSNTV